MKSKTLWKRVILTILLLLGSAVTGLILIILVRLIPQRYVADNIKGSVAIFEEEPQLLWKGISGTQIDDFTDGLMLNIAYTQTGNVIQDALLSPYLKYEDSIDPTIALYNRIWLEDTDVKVTEYGRYWHGHQIIVKPLLVAFSISSIRYINLIMQIAVLFCILALLMKKNQMHLFLPLIIMWITLVPISLFFALQYSTVYYITMLCVIALLLDTKQKSLWRKCIIFEMCGVLIAYFDLLTYPLVSLGVPLILLLSMERKENSWKKVFTTILGCSTMWSIGYLGMWLSKCILASLFTKENILLSAYNSFKFRSSHELGPEKFTWIQTIKSNAMIYRNGVFLILLMLIVLIAIALRLRNKTIDINLCYIIGVMCVVLYPIAWYGLTMNHSVIHAIYTFRELAIVWYGLSSILLVCEKKEKNTKA